MSKGCNTQGQGPRSKPVPLLVQDGWEYGLSDTGALTRTPIMREHTTQWMTKHPDGTPLLCGYIRKDGDHQSDLCAGCENEAPA